MAYSISTGSFFCSVHGDDYIPKQSFEKRISPLLLFGNDYAASACKIQMFSKDSRFDGVITPRDKNKGTFIGASIMYTKKIAQKIYPIPKTLPSEDRWQGLCIENLNKNTFHVPEVLYFYRIHANNSSSRMSMFENKNISMHKRFMVFKLFYDKFKSDIGESKKKKILALIEAEKSRYNNKSWKILFIKNLSIKNKIRFLFHSNKFLYSIRISFFRFFSGWGE